MHIHAQRKSSVNPLFVLPYFSYLSLHFSVFLSFLKSVSLHVFHYVLSTFSVLSSFGKHVNHH